MGKVKSFVLGIIALVIVLSGCSIQIGETTQEPITGLDDGYVKVIREDEGPSQGGTLNLFMVTPRTLNPLITNDLYVRQLSTFVFDGLFYEDDLGSIKEGLVSKYSLSEDSLIIDIELKDNIAFHDGKLLTSDDVAFSFETIQSAGNKSLYYQYISNIQSIKTLTRLSLRIILKKADTQAISRLTFPIIPQHIFKDWPIEGHNDSMKLIGTGPFKFDSYIDDSIKLIRNDFWWVTKSEDSLLSQVWLDGITFNVYSNESDMMQAFQRQQIDIAWLEEGEIESYSKRADIFFNRYVSNMLEFLVLSPVGEKNSPMEREEFRNIIVKYLRNYAISNSLGKGLQAHTPESNDDSISSIDKEKAITMLSEIEFDYDSERKNLYFYKNNYKYPVSLSLIYNGLNSDREIISLWLVEALSHIGIKVDVKAATYDELQVLISSGKFDMMLLGCRIPLYTNESETLDILKSSLNLDSRNDVILPLYRKFGAVLYHNYIRGERNPFWKNIYNGWQQWYLVNSQP